MIDSPKTQGVLTIELRFRYKGSRAHALTTLASDDEAENGESMGLTHASEVVVKDILALGASVELPDRSLLVCEKAQCRCYWDTFSGSVSLVSPIFHR